MNEMILQDDPYIHLFAFNYLSLHIGKKPQMHYSIIQLEASRFTAFHIRMVGILKSIFCLSDPKIWLETPSTILLPLPPNTILYISFLWFVFQFKTPYHKERRDNDGERLGLCFPQISHHFLCIDAATPSQLSMDGFAQSHT